MYPILLTLGTLKFHSYTVFLSVGFVVGVLLSVRENYKLEKPYPITTAGGLIVFFLALVGSRMWYIVHYDGSLQIWKGFFFWEGGLVFYGGLFGGILGALIYFRWCRVPAFALGDIIMPFIPLSHGIARIGCFLNGCCYGRVTDMPWGVCYPKRSAGVYMDQVRHGMIDGKAEHSLPVHPSQIYETLLLFVLFVLLRYAYKKGVHHGRTGAVVLLYPIGYGVIRFITESFRADNLRSVMGVLTVSQVVALCFIATGLLGYVAGYAYFWRKSAEPVCAEGPAEEDTPEETEER